MGVKQHTISLPRVVQREKNEGLIHKKGRL